MVSPTSTTAHRPIGIGIALHNSEARESSERLHCTSTGEEGMCNLWSLPRSCFPRPSRMDLVLLYSLVLCFQLTTVLPVVPICERAYTGSFTDAAEVCVVLRSFKVKRVWYCDSKNTCIPYTRTDGRAYGENPWFRNLWTLDGDTMSQEKRWRRMVGMKTE